MMLSSWFYPLKPIGVPSIVEVQRSTGKPMFMQEFYDYSKVPRKPLKKKDKYLDDYSKYYLTLSLS